jgi:hypothetical protein
VEDKHATQTSVPIPPPTDEVDITSDVIKSIPTDDIDLIKFVINTMLENNYNKKVDINEIMRELENYYFTNNLDTYKTFIIEEKHGFNKSTFLLFLRDKGLTLLLTCVISLKAQHSTLTSIIYSTYLLLTLLMRAKKVHSTPPHFIENNGQGLMVRPKLTARWGTLKSDLKILDWAYRYNKKK